MRAGAGILRRREGLLVHLEAGGASGWGEAAPLPGFSRETLGEAARALREAKPRILGRELQEATIPGGELPPSARFALELARLSLEAASSGRPLHILLSGEAASGVSVCGLLEGPPERVLSGAGRMREAGYEAVKLKVGRADPAEEAALVRELSALLGGRVRLRLDANRAWDLEEALDFCRAIGGVPLDYLEEPLASPEGLPRLAEVSGVPLALDETLLGLEPEGLARFCYARAVVLKPTLLGGLSRSLRFAREARRAGMVPVASSAYESGVGTLGLLALAASLGDAPAGLDTYRSLKDDVLRPPLPLAGPRAGAAALFGERRAVVVERLEEVAA